MDDKKYFRAINFDLKLEFLRVHFSSSDPKQAYKLIKRFLLANGFIHRQWSGYKSKNKLSDQEVIFLVDKMFQIFPWLDLCATRFDVTNIGKTYDILAIRVASKSPARKEKMNISREGRVNGGSAFSSAHSKTKVTKSEDEQKQYQFKPKR